MSIEGGFVLVGSPGAGKSRMARGFAKSHPAIVIEGDSFASESWVDTHDQILAELEQHVGEMVILDGCHYSRESRLGALITLRSLGWTKITAVVVHPPLDTCLFRNAARSRVVPRHYIIEMHRKVEKSLKKIETEGFTSVIYAPEGDWV
jgi:predicted kinase